MPYTNSDGIRLHYAVRGEGTPLVLLHGWTASAGTNFDAFGWSDALAPHYRLVMPDLRGHGRSAKPWRRAAYSPALMAADVMAVMDAAGAGRALLLGYSTGATVAVELLVRYPGRFGAAVLGGIGTEFHASWGRRGAPEDGLPRPWIDWFPRRNARAFLGWLRNDPIALGCAFAGMFHNRPPVDLDRLGDIRAPVLVVDGTRDGFCRSAPDLVARIPGARLATISGRNHATTIGDRRFKEIALAFLAGVPGCGAPG